MRNLLGRMENAPRWLKFGVVVGLVLLLDLVSHLTPDGFSFSVFYVLPVVLAAWWGGIRMAYTIAVLAALAILHSGQWVPLYEERPWIRYWNGFSPFLLFVMILHLALALRTRLDVERERAQRDGLTGLLNMPAFMLQAEEEIARARRFGRPFGVAFMDLDNFKEVNDSRGHLAGDQVLRAVADGMRHVLRESDVLARAGGDEFVVLLPEAGPQGAKAAVESLRDALLKTMAELECPVTFSIGLVVFTTPPADVESMVRLADKLMYEVKQGGKNAIHSAVFEGP